jgi:probable HAF family extracellular repeat protein
MQFSKWVGAAAWGVFVTMNVIRSASAQSAPVTHLGDLGGFRTDASDINDAGTVVGSAIDAAGKQRAFKWTSAAGINAISLNDNNASASAISPLGAIGGWNIDQATRWGAGGTFTPLGTLGGSLALSGASGINDSVHVVGYSQSTSGGTVTYRGFYHNTTNMLSMGFLPGGTNSYANDLNNAGQAVGWAGAGDGTHHATSYTVAGGLVDLGIGVNSEASAINQTGSIVGWQQPAGSGVLPWIKRPGQPLKMLGLGAASGGRPNDVNDTDVAAGSLGGHAAVWFDYDNPVDLDVWLDANYPSVGALWMLTSATGINNTGLLVGHGTFDDGPGGFADGNRSFVLDLTSVPEPASASAALLGVALIATRRRARSRNAS